MKILVLSDLGVLLFMEKLTRYKEYSRTINGVISTIYKTQIRNSKIRGHEPPKYTKEDFKSWLLNKTEFMSYYGAWCAMGYQKDLKPSIDRLDDYKDYSFDNIRLVVWYVNRMKANSDMKNGINNKQNKAVIQYSKDGFFIKEYHSVNEASRLNSIGQSCITKVCNNIKGRKTAGGFIWKYKIETEIINNYFNK